MLSEIFYWIFNMSIAASICGLPILLLRLIKGLPRRYLVILWSIPFIRMCVPVGISSKYGIMAFISHFTTKTVTVYEAAEGIDVTIINYAMVANTYFPVTYKVDLTADLFYVASIIWAIVALAIILALLIIYITTLRELKGASHIKDNIYLSDKVNIPSVYGIIRPRIVLPPAYSKNELDYILMHERAHIRRGDNLARTVALLAVCVHWFNPLAWLFLKLLYADIELACDEAVLASCNEGQKKEYAHVLLTSVEKSNVFAATFGGAKVRTRIENIFSYKRLSITSAIACAALILSMFYILLTNA